MYFDDEQLKFFGYTDKEIAEKLYSFSDIESMAKKVVLDLIEKGYRYDYVKEQVVKGA